MSVHVITSFVMCLQGVLIFVSFVLKSYAFVSDYKGMKNTLFTETWYVYVVCVIYMMLSVGFGAV